MEPKDYTSSRMSLPLANIPIPVTSNPIKLPPCDTEVFEGSYEKWRSIRDMFTALYINGSNCAPVVELYHLRRKTTSEAGAIVKRFPLCDESFEQAWTAIKDRYENEREMGDQLIQTLFNIPTATSEDSKTLQNIHSTVCDVLQGLKTLDIKIEYCDIFIVFLVRSKLPKETLSLWEQSLQNHRSIIKWSQLEDFLKDRYEAVERINSMESMKHRMSLPNVPTDSPTQIHSFASQEKSNVPCKLCSADHNLRKCPKFRRFTIQERIDYVLGNKICNNCLSPSHIKTSKMPQQKHLFHMQKEPSYLTLFNETKLYKYIFVFRK